MCSKNKFYMRSDIKLFYCPMIQIRFQKLQTMASSSPAVISPVQFNLSNLKTNVDLERFLTGSGSDVLFTS